jgi:hypothetical protein
MLKYDENAAPITPTITSDPIFIKNLLEMRLKLFYKKDPKKVYFLLLASSMAKRKEFIQFEDKKNKESFKSF